MESDDPYDSLEEDCATTISGASISPRRLIPKIIQLKEPDITHYLPLYGREVAREDIKSCTNLRAKFMSKIPILPSRIKMGSINSSVKDTKSDNLLLKNTKSYSSFQSMNSLNDFVKNKPKKSYLEMFHEKLGYTWKAANRDEIPDTRRATCNEDTFRTAKSNSDSSDFADAASFVSDSSSFYHKYIEEDKTAKNYQNFELIGKLSLGSLTDSHNNNSLSEYSTKSSETKSSSKTNKKSTFTLKSKSKASVTELPALGGLGPDRDSIKEKLVNLKRQQSYGQRMSNRNRIKMLEMKVVKDFKIELKKSSELNKYTYNVLNG